MPSAYAVSIFDDARASAVNQFASADLSTLAQAWATNAKALASTWPNSECAKRVRALARYDAMKAAGRRLGVDMRDYG